jgi:hypothetical protein
VGLEGADLRGANLAGANSMQYLKTVRTVAHLPERRN